MSAEHPSPTVPWDDGGAENPRDRFHRRAAGILAAALSVGFFAVFYALHLRKWAFFDPSCLDVNGIISQNFEARLGVPSPYLIWLVVPIVYIISWGSIAHPTPEYVLALNPLFSAAQLAVLYFIAQRVTRRPWLSLALTAAYALNPWLELYAMLGIKTEPIGMFFGFLALAAAMRNRTGLAIAAAVVCCSAKIEFVPVIFLVFGWFALRYRNASHVRALGVVTLCGLYYFGMWVAYLLQKNPDLRMSDSLDSGLDVLLAGGWGELFHTVASPLNLRLVGTLVPVLFLSLAAPYLAFIPSIFHIGLTLVFSGVWDGRYWGTQTLIDGDSFWAHLPRMPAVWIGFVHLSAVFGAQRVLARVSAEKRDRAAGALAVALVLASAAYHYAAAYPLAGPPPLSRWWSAYSYRYHPTEDSRLIRATLDRVGQSTGMACMSYQYPYYFPEFVAGGWSTRYRGFPCAEIDKAGTQTVLVDLYLSTYPRRWEILAALRKALADPAYRLAEFRGGLVLLERADPVTVDPAPKQAVLDFIAANEDILNLTLFDRQLYKVLLARRGALPAQDPPLPPSLDPYARMPDVIPEHFRVDVPKEP